MARVVLRRAKPGQVIVSATKKLLEVFFMIVAIKGKKTFMLSVIAVILFETAFAQQKQTEYFSQVWLGYLNQTRLNDKWALWADFHLRAEEDVSPEVTQTVARIGVSYYVHDPTRFTAGYAYLNSYPADNQKNVVQPEHRFWEQIHWQKDAKTRKVHRIRLEERFRKKILGWSQLGSGYSMNYRIRYSFTLLAPLSKKKFQPHGFVFVANDEVFLNFGRQIVYNYFDQNRIFMGLGYQVNKDSQLQFGYMNLFQQLSSGNQYKVIHAARIFYYHNIDLRKAKTPSSP